MSSFSLLGHDYQALSKESGRRHSDVREASDKAFDVIKNNKLDTVDRDAPSNVLYDPIFLAAGTRNAKVIALAVTILQRLISLNEVGKTLVPPILRTLHTVLAQGVEIQLKVLQTLVSLLTTRVDGHALVQGDELAEALELSYSLSKSKTTVVASTASATLRQLFMFVFERIGAPGTAAEPAAFAVDVPVDDGTESLALGTSARDAYLLFEDLCLLIAGAHDSPAPAPASTEPSILRWTGLSQTFGLELVESIISGFGGVVRAHPELLLVLRAHLCPLLLRFMELATPTASGRRPAFPLTLRATRVVFLLLQQFVDLLPREARVFLSLLTDVVADTRGPPWLRVLALEVFRGLCSDFELVVRFYTSYGDAVLSPLITALHDAAERDEPRIGPGSAVLYGRGGAPAAATPGDKTILDSAAGMIGLASAAPAIQTLALESAAMKLQCIDQLDKAEAPAIPELYPVLLVLQCMVCVSDGFGSALSGVKSGTEGGVDSDSGAVSSAPEGASSEQPPAKSDSPTVISKMLDLCAPALLSSLTLFLTKSIDDVLFANTVGAFKSVATVAGIVRLKAPCEAFLVQLCQLSVPPAVLERLASIDTRPAPASPNTASTLIQAAAASAVAAGAESLGLGHAPGPSETLGLSTRNLVCLKALIETAEFLSEFITTTWGAVLETLQSADYIVRLPPATAAEPTPRVPSGVRRIGSAAPAAPAPVVDDEVADLQSTVLAKMDALFHITPDMSIRAFQWFVHALCALDDAMLASLERKDEIKELAGTDAEGEKKDADVSEPPSDVPTPTSPTLHVTQSTPRLSASSAPSSSRPAIKLGDRLFGLAKIGTIAFLNIDRLIQSLPQDAWDIIVKHVLGIVHLYGRVPHIRLQAADILDQLLLRVSKAVSALARSADDSHASTVTSSISLLLEALVDQAEPFPKLAAGQGITMTDTEIRRMSLDTLNKIIQVDGQVFEKSGWERVFSILLTTIATGKDAAKTSPMLVRTAFPSLQLICTDFVDSLTVEELERCIFTLVEFGKQKDDVNVALTASGLLWGISDHLQTVISRRQREQESASEYEELWMYLLRSQLALCSDKRQEVRDGAITTVFRSISIYGSKLIDSDWENCLNHVVFPLFAQVWDGASASEASATANQLQVTSESMNPNDHLHFLPDGTSVTLTDKQWDDSKTLVLRSTSGVIYEYLGAIISAKSFSAIWKTLIGLFESGFRSDRVLPKTASMQALEKIMSSSAFDEENGGSAREKVVDAIELAWQAWSHLGQSFAEESERALSQNTLEAYVKAFSPILHQGSTYGLFEGLERPELFFDILYTVITYNKSQDYRPDVDSLSPVQSAITSILDSIDLSQFSTGVSSLMLKNMSKYIRLAFEQPFEVVRSAQYLSRSSSAQKQSITYVALCKSMMAQVCHKFDTFNTAADERIYTDGAVRSVIEAYSVPIKLKHECPKSYRFVDTGSEKPDPLWKTATLAFVKIVKDVVKSLACGNTFALSPAGYDSIWEAVVDGLKGGLVVDQNSSVYKRPDRLVDKQIYLEENFDLVLLLTIGNDIIPYVSAPSVTDKFIYKLCNCLRIASEISTVLPEDDDEELDEESDASSEITRYADFMERPVVGNTTEITHSARERFGYWALDLLFLACTKYRGEPGTDISNAYKRISAIALPLLLERSALCIKQYTADSALRGKMPFSRLRHDEMVYILQKLLAMDIPEGVLCNALAYGDAKPIKRMLLDSRVGHLYELQTLLMSPVLLTSQSAYSTKPFWKLVTANMTNIDGTLQGLPAGVTPHDFFLLFGDQENETDDIPTLVLDCLRRVSDEVHA